MEDWAIKYLQLQFTNLPTQMEVGWVGSVCPPGRNKGFIQASPVCWNAPGQAVASVTEKRLIHIL